MRAVDIEHGSEIIAPYCARRRVSTPQVQWLSCAASIAVVLGASVGVAVLGILQRESLGGRVSRRFVTGRAAIAVGDSGVFASPVVPYGIRPIVPHADAESTAVAASYMFVPGYQDLTALPRYEEIPLERRHFCGRSYYVRPVVLMPDTTRIYAKSGNDWAMWAPSWVIPICDDAGRVRASEALSDFPLRLHVIQGDQPGEVPQIVDAPGTHAIIGGWQSGVFPDWERGIGITPESAVDVAVRWLGGSGARVSEVPEAFSIILPPDVSRPITRDSQPFAPTAQCARWRLTLDRPVTLRGALTGQVARTRIVYVTRGNGGCRGVPVLEIPRPVQPTTVPFMYTAPTHPERVRPPVPRYRPPLPVYRWTRVAVTQPIYFEAAQLVPR